MDPPSDSPQCEYICRDGRRCENRCRGSKCFRHKRKTGHTLCLNGCGHGTLSSTGYCGTCDDSMQGGMQRRTRQRNRTQAKAQNKLNEDLEAYLREYLI
jgi:hypothetical protein